jgi:hypothetical protein
MALAVALPAVAACTDADCCLDAALEGSCPGCSSIDCGDENPEMGTIGPTTSLEPPVAPIEVLTPTDSTPRASAKSDPAPSIYPCLETTVLRI